MVMTLGEYIRKDDKNLAVAIVMLMRLRESKGIENIEDYKDDVLRMFSYLKMPVDLNNPFPWMH